ncbi:hypothetical protein CMV_008519 [Castanea mollissima]|uniref:Legume lectin domain-containing protein n=1 Tax=Castanea mollissima TaxID=60419 RepID=A0A8J4RRM6_9ROSI|nr:hypothetical protein CMV_008519 [Castanea mollissima]
MISFSFPDFLPNDNNIIVSGTASKAQVDEHPSIRLTDNVDDLSDNKYSAIGRAYYYKPILLWDSTTNVTTNFTTTFEFVIRTRNGESSYNSSGGGIAFFITSEDSVDAPTNSGGSYMGIFNGTTEGKSSSKMVAVEFDTWQDEEWGDAPSDNHVGIDVNSLVSKANSTWNLTSGDILVATVSYDGTSEILSVFLKYLNLPNLPLNLTHNVKLRDVLPEKVMMGFSAATGGGVPVQAIRSWNFSSTLDLGSTQNGGKGSFKMWLIGLIIGLVLLLVVGLSFGSYILWRNSKRKVAEEDEELIEVTGPKMFAYKDLVVATNNFSEEGKLGQGGFGSVYKGFLAKTKMEIAVKKISSNSKQGKKEYSSEGRLLEAVDETLNGDYDMDEMQRLMVIGLWCAHPDHTSRPSIRQAIRVLNYEASLPSLPSKMPLPSYYYAPEAMTADQIQSTSTSKGGSTSATKDDSRV